MNRWEARLQHAANLLVGGTGIVYAVMRYLMEPADEWAVVNHPWQPHVQHLHVLAAPLLVFACGLIWSHHVAGNLARAGRRGRRTGPGLLLALAPMVASGYLIQTTVSEAWREIWILAHLISSGVWLLAFAAHLVRPYLGDIPLFSSFLSGSATGAPRDGERMKVSEEKAECPLSQRQSPEATKAPQPNG